ncbi:hypothetical protein D3C80_813170 [compost metagenome]
MQVVFGGGIQRGGGFVEDHHLGLGEHHPGDGQALALSTGQTHAGAPDDTVQAIGQIPHRAVQLGYFQCMPASLVSALTPHGQVGPDGVVEQRRMLQDHGNIFPHGFQADLLLGRTAKANGSGQRRVQTQQQLHQRALAPTTGADDRDLFAGGDGQVHLVQDQFIAITEAQPLYFQPDGLAPDERVDAARVFRLISARQQLIDPRQRTAGSVVGILQVQQLFNRADHEPQVAEHREHLAD